jgi:hypothetical protein
MNKYTKILIDKIFTNELPANELEKISKQNLKLVYSELENRDLPEGNRECLELINTKRSKQKKITIAIGLATIAVLIGLTALVLNFINRPDPSIQINATQKFTSQYIDAKDKMNIQTENLINQTNISDLGKINVEGAKEVLVDKSDNIYKEAKSQTDKMSSVSFDNYNKSFQDVNSSLNELKQITNDNNYISRAIILQYNHNEQLPSANFKNRANIKIAEIQSKYEKNHIIFNSEKLNEYTSSIKELNKNFDNVAKHFIGKDKINESADNDISDFAKFTGKNRSDFISDTQYNVANILQAYQEKINEYLKKVPSQQNLIVKDELLVLESQDFKNMANKKLDLYLATNK